MRFSFAAAAWMVLAACAPEEPLRAPHPSYVRDDLRPTDTSSSEMWRYLSTDVIERFDAPDSGYRVHFTRAGKNAVPAADVNTNGTPDLVEAVASVYEEVGAKYHASMGFLRPLNDVALGSNGGSDRFDIYLVDFALQADGAFRSDACASEKCIGYVVQENDFAGYNYPNATVATRILGSHEYFHAIQAAYDSEQGVGISEGTAVWATEQFDPSTNDFEGFLSGFMSRPDRSLDSPPSGPVPAFAYGSAIFFEFLSEKYGVPIIRKLWERCENGKGHASEPADVANPRWIVQLDALLKTEYQSSFAEAFRTFVFWNLFTGAAADPTKAYANGANYPGPLMTPVNTPYLGIAQRVFYAATTYLQLEAGGRATMGALLVDDPMTVEDETQGMALVLAVRRANKNTVVVAAADVKVASPLDTSGSAQLIVAVVNTAREGSNGVLSKRPGVCVGTPAELVECHKALDPAFDAGAPDAGAPDAGPFDAGVTPIDAGTIADAGTEPPPMPKGCGCSSASPMLGALLALAFAIRRRRSSGP
jgi:MYXO-CTERM domain-containing protein